MVERFYAKENKPFPNSQLPILYYPKAITDFLDSDDSRQKVLNLFEKNGYASGWTGSIFTYHHFHSNTHEVLACLSGKATVQLGGPDAETYTFAKGDVLLLPAGVTHKRIDSTNDFEIVGAYPNGLSPDMQKGEAKDYEEIKQRISEVDVPSADPVEGQDGAVRKYWT